MWYQSLVVKQTEIENLTGEDGAGSPYARLVGQRLRSIRAQKKLSLDAVEELSNGEFKASVLGAYERGERAISVPRLARLALIYEAPVDQLLPDPGDADGAPPSNRGGAGEKVAVDLSRLAELDGPNFEMLARYLKMIQHARGDFNGKVLTIRADDMRAVAAMFDLSVEQAVRKLDAWGLRYTPNRD
jgi:transcriptional regulator with XRE-family HTH domain